MAGLFGATEQVEVRMWTTSFWLQLLSVAGLFRFLAKDVYAPKENLFFHLWERDYRRVYWKDNRPGKLDFLGGVVGLSWSGLYCRMRLRQGTLRLSAQGSLQELRTLQLVFEAASAFPRVPKSHWKASQCRLHGLLDGSAPGDARAWPLPGWAFGPKLN